MAPKTQAFAPAGMWITRRGLEQVWLAALCAAALVLGLVHLPYAPPAWFDEGSILHVPKTLVEHGVYADISSEGYRYYGPTVGVGPTVILPIALVFKLFGVGLIQGRLVIVVYLLAALAACYALARRISGRFAALLALTLLLASRTFGQPGALEYGRQALGEVPGVAFLLLGTLAWVSALQAGGGWWRISLAGLGFGLALVTKNQFVLIVPAVLLIAGLLDWRYYRAGSWALRIVPLAIACACFGVWIVAQFQFLGPGSFMENMRQTRQAAGGAIFVFDRQAVLRAARYLVRPDLYGGLLILSLVYGIWRCRRRDAQGLAEALVVLTVGLWLLWYAGASLGWPRYAFPAVAFGAITVARLLGDLAGRLSRGPRVQRRLVAVLAIYVALIAGVPLGLSARSVLTPDDSAQRFAAYLEANVPNDQIIETWEPELGVLTNHRYHYPPIALLDTAVRHEWLGGPAAVYEQGLLSAPAYVVVGGFGSYTHIYPADVLAQKYVEQERIGPYTLFRRR